LPGRPPHRTGTSVFPPPRVGGGTHPAAERSADAFVRKSTRLAARFPIQIRERPEVGDFGDRGFKDLALRTELADDIDGIELFRAELHGLRAHEVAAHPTVHALLCKALLPHPQTASARPHSDR
jgi:hypothetical protein